MDTDSPDSGKRGNTLNFTVWAIALLLLHPLSVGPANYALARGWIVQGSAEFRLVDGFYWPETKLIDQFPDTSSRVFAYCAWWRELARPSSATSPAP